MIKETEVEITLNGKNIRHYQQCGYEIPTHVDKYGKVKFSLCATILVKIEHLHTGSGIKITPICNNPDCKGEEHKIPYRVYLGYVSQGVSVYYCTNCKSMKRELFAKSKQECGELKRGDKYYWSFRENIIKEIQLHLDKYKTLDDMSKTNNCLLQAVRKYFPKLLPELVVEAGYVYEEVCSYDPYGYYHNKQKVMETIISFIEKHKRFPLKQDFDTIDLKVPVSQMVKHCGSLEKLRKDLNYTGDHELLIDNRGDVNRSVCELYVANWLIAQGYKDKYTREQYPFLNEGQYRSDFTLYLTEEQKEIHIEVWGHPKGDKSSRGEDYNKNRNIKESLYDKYKDTIVLISLEYTDIYSSKNMNKVLFEKLSPFLHIEFEIVSWEKIKSFQNMSEKETLFEIMKYSSDGKTMPRQIDLQKNARGKSLVVFIQSKFGGIQYFANKYNLQTHYKLHQWNESKVYETFEHILHTYKSIPATKKINKLKQTDNKLKGFIAYIDNNGGFVFWKTKFYNYCEEKNIAI